MTLGCPGCGLVDGHLDGCQVLDRETVGDVNVATTTRLLSPHCPNCLGGLIVWADIPGPMSIAGELMYPDPDSFGKACIECRLFFRFHEGLVIETRPLTEVPFPHRYRDIPAYRSAVGWCGP